MANRSEFVSKSEAKADDDMLSSDVWETLFHVTKSKIIDAPKQKIDLPVIEKPEKIFNTNSKYEGQWNELDMSGHGTYTFFTGTKYVGSMKDGIFHGEGILYFPNNSRIEGMWNEGHLCEYKFFYADGKELKPEGDEPDRRYYSEMLHGLKPAGRSNITSEIPSRPVPEGFYDTGDGFYNPKIKCVVDANDTEQIIRIPSKKEHEWILKNCRTYKESHAGYLPQFYEDWVYPETSTYPKC